MKLVEKTVIEYCDELDSVSPAPGGGSSGALVGALGVSCIRMYGHHTLEKKAFQNLSEEEKNQFIAAFEALLPLKEIFLEGVDDDAKSYDAVIAAYRLPKESEEEKEIRKASIQEALHFAVKTPEKMCVTAHKALELTLQMIPYGNKNLYSDALTGAAYLKTVLETEILNVYANTRSFEDQEEAQKLNQNMEDLCVQANHIYQEIVQGDPNA